MKSLKRHLTTWLLLGTTVIVVGGGVAIHVLVMRSMSELVDRGLTEKAAALSALIEREILSLEFHVHDLTMPEFSRTEDPHYFRILLDDGKELARSRSLGTATLVEPELTPDQASFVTGLLPDGREGRVAAVRLAIPKQKYKASPADEEKIKAAHATAGLPYRTHVTVIVAREARELFQISGALLTALLVSGSALLIGMAILVRSVVASAFSPVDALGRKIDALAPETAADAGLDLACPAEIEPFKQGFLRFAQRIKESIEREKRITSNIAHELRTPIAELRTVTEVARQWPDDVELAKKSLEDAHDISLQMERVLKTCLRIARIESGQDSVKTHEVDISLLLTNLCRQADGFANEKAIKLDEVITPACSVRSDHDILELILGNLVDNAFHHAPQGACVRVTAAPRDGGVEITLTNPVEGLEAADLSKLAEPFWRKDTARTASRHLGLGLTMARSAARVIGAELQFAVRDGRFVTRLLVSGA